MTGVMGPFDTSGEAHAAAVLAVGDTDDPVTAAMGMGNWELLSGALEDAGVVLGRYDSRIVEWLSRYEPSTVAVIAGWITRARGVQADG